MSWGLSSEAGTSGYNGDWVQSILIYGDQQTALAGERVTGYRLYCSGGNGSSVAQKLAVYNVTDASPNNATLVSGSLATAIVPTTAAWVTVMLDTPVNLTEGQKYGRWFGRAAASLSQTVYRIADTGMSRWKDVDLSLTPQTPYGTPGGTDNYDWAMEVITDIVSSTPTITDVNGDDTVEDGSTGNTITFSGAITALNSLTIENAAGDPLTGGSLAGSGTDWTFSLPALSALLPHCGWGASRTLIANVDTSEESGVDIEFTVTVSPATGQAAVTLAGGFDTSDQSIVFGFDPAAETGSQLEHVAAEITPGTDALFYTSLAKTHIIRHWLPSTGLIYIEEVITGDVPSADGSGFTARGFTARGFTARGFTARGF